MLLTGAPDAALSVTVAAAQKHLLQQAYSAMQRMQEGLH
jgi:hypothetical protein